MKQVFKNNDATKRDEGSDCQAILPSWFTYVYFSYLLIFTMNGRIIQIVWYLFLHFLIYICQTQILAVRQKPAFLRKLVPLYQRSHFLLAGRSDKWPSVMVISIPKYRRASRLIHYHRNLLHISESLLVAWLFSPAPPVKFSNSGTSSAQLHIPL